jgi:MscS family membrane protein
VFELALPDRETIRENASVLTFGLNAVPALQHTLLGRPLWQYLATALYLLLAFYAAKLVDWLIHARLRAWAARTASRWDDLLVGLLDGPVKIIVFVLLVNVGLQLFDWPDWCEAWVRKLTILAVGLSLLLVVLKAVDAAVQLWQQGLPADGDRQFNEQFVALVGRALKGVLIVVAVFTVLGNLGFDIRAALASVSVVGLALGLAAQDTVANLFGAVAVFVDKPFKLGDRVRIGDVDGMVEEMGLRSTRIRALDGALITVPNKNVGSATVINLSRRPTIRATFGLGLVYDTPAARLREAAALLETVLRNHPATHDCIVHFNRFGDFALNLDVVWWCRTTDWKEYTRHLQELNLAIKERFDAAGFDFAFPTQTVHVPRGDHDPRLEAAKDSGS